MTTEAMLLTFGTPAVTAILSIGGARAVLTQMKSEIIELKTQIAMKAEKTDLNEKVSKTEFESHIAAGREEKQLLHQILDKITDLTVKLATLETKLNERTSKN